MWGKVAVRWVGRASSWNDLDGLRLVREGVLPGVQLFSLTTPGNLPQLHSRAAGPSPAESRRLNCVWNCDIFNRAHTLPVSRRGGTLVPTLGSSEILLISGSFTRSGSQACKARLGPGPSLPGIVPSVGKTPAPWLPGPHPLPSPPLASTLESGIREVSRALTSYLCLASMSGSVTK